MALYSMASSAIVSIVPQVLQPDVLVRRVLIVVVIGD
jgi:hypothetical protein